MFKKSYDVVAALLFNDLGEILITRRPAGSHLAGYWEFPGGKVEDNELPEQALIREIKEEINLDIEVEKIFWQEDFEYDIKMVHLAFYFCRRKISQQKITPRQVADFRWIDIKDLTQYHFPEADSAMINILKKTIKGSKTIW